MKTPPNVYTKFGDEKLGNIIPQIVITDPSSNKIWDAIAYKAINEKRLRAAKTNIREKLGEWDPNHPMVIPNHALRWANKENRFYTGKFIKVDDQFLYISTSAKNKKPMKLSFAKLAPSTVAYAKKLSAAKRAATIAEKMPTLSDEVWTSTDGKPLTATYVSLEEGKITLKNSSGQVYTFDLTRLNDASQTRAKEIADQIKEAQAQ